MIQMQKTETPFKKVVKTAVLSLAIVLFFNLGIMALAIAGIIEFNPAGYLLGQNDFFGPLLFVTAYFLPYILIAYIAKKENLKFYQHIFISLICFFLTLVLTYLVSEYLFINYGYANPYIPGFWHYTPGDPKFVIETEPHPLGTAILGLFMSLGASLSYYALQFIRDH
jgi:phosphoglycerol transferase MdoB-like AlkP superfamily enzyme